MDANFVVPESSVKPANEIFIVDDEEDMRDIIAAALAPERIPVTTFADGDALLSALGLRVPLCVFLDVAMPRRSGLDILKEIRARNLWTPTFLISGVDDVSIAVEAMKYGAYDYIRKPVDRFAPGQRARKAIELWATHKNGLSLRPECASEDCDWMRLTSSEKEMVMLMRFMRVCEQ